jgi:hypothetical protein
MIADHATLNGLSAITNGHGSKSRSPLRPVFSGTASYKLHNMSVASDVHPVINKDRVAVVTGAANGIGRAAALEFAK